MNETQEITLADLKAGDVAYIEPRGYGRSIEQVTITKITATQFVCSDGERYRREDGKSIEKVEKWGTRYYPVPATPDIVAAYQRERNLAVVRGVEWKELDDETLAAVVALLPGKGA